MRRGLGAVVSELSGISLVVVDHRRRLVDGNELRLTPVQRKELAAIGTAAYGPPTPQTGRGRSKNGGAEHPSPLRCEGCCASRLRSVRQRKPVAALGRKGSEPVPGAQLRRRNPRAPSTGSINQGGTSGRCDRVTDVGTCGAQHALAGTTGGVGRELRRWLSAGRQRPTIARRHSEPDLRVVANPTTSPLPLSADTPSPVPTAGSRLASLWLGFGSTIATRVRHR